MNSCCCSYDRSVSNSCSLCHKIGLEFKSNFGETKKNLTTEKKSGGGCCTTSFVLQFAILLEPSFSLLLLIYVWYQFSRYGDLIQFYNYWRIMLVKNSFVLYNCEWEYIASYTWLLDMDKIIYQLRTQTDTQRAIIATLRS